MSKYVKGRKISFDSEPATKFYNQIFKNFPKLLKGKKNIIMVPCASTKPIQLSISHCYLSPITRKINSETLLLIISEPLTIIPYEQEIYPNYEYLPKDVLENKNELSLFIKRLTNFYKIVKNANKKISSYYIGGLHHHNILKKVGWDHEFWHPKLGIRDYSKTAQKLSKKIYSDLNYKKVKISDLGTNRKFVKINYQLIENHNKNL